MRGFPVIRIRKSRPRWWSYEEFIFTVQRYFIEYGYKCTRIDDIAMEAEVPKGTVYCYVQSKEALFWLALRWAGATFTARPHRSRPIQAPSRRSIQRHVLKLLEQILEPPPINTAPPPRPLEEARAEFRAVLLQIYTRLFENRTAIRLIQRCAHEHPALQDLFMQPRKKAAVVQLAQFLEVHQEYLRRHAQPEVVARTVYATIAFMAVYRKWHAAEIMIRRTREMRDTLLDTLADGMLQQRPPLTPEELEALIPEGEAIDDFDPEYERMQEEKEAAQGFSLLRWLGRPYPDQWDVNPEDVNPEGVNPEDVTPGEDSD
jgi:AcrR family transcriptional regulator